MPSGRRVVCIEPGCDRNDIKAKGLCGTHYDRQWAKDKRGDQPLRVLAKDQECAFEGCERLVGGGGARGYCSSHARAFYKGTLGNAPAPDPSPTAECPICHQVKKLDRNHKITRQRVCQTCYRDRELVAPEDRKKPGPKPKTYAERPSCSEGHPYVEGSFSLDSTGRRRCLVCLEGRRKTHCPQGHPYDDENSFLVNGSPQCKICRNKRMRERRNTGVGQGGVNAAKTHCPRGHEYTPENTLRSKDGRRRSCRICATSKGSVQNLRRFNLTPERFEAMIQEVDGKCPICTWALDVVGIHIDHDHKCCNGPFSCGKCVRSLLCKDCNPGLGYFHDDPVRLRAAALYLESYA